MQSYTPRSNNRSVTIGLIKGAKRSLDIEIPLFETHSERERCDSIAELYSIIVAINILEKGYIRDEFVDKEEYYTNTTMRFIKQFYLILENDDVKREFENIDSFVTKYQLSCPLAVKRLKIRMPATIEHLPMVEEETKEITNEKVHKTGKEKSDEDGLSGSKEENEETTADNGNAASEGYKGRAIAEATGAFITLMDAIKLNYNTKEQLHPLLTDIVTATNKVFENYEGRPKLVQWLITLNGLKFDEALSENQVKELLWDVDSAYKGFFAKLG